MCVLRVCLKDGISEEAQVRRPPHQAMGKHDQVPRSCHFILLSQIESASTDLANAGCLCFPFLHQSLQRAPLSSIAPRSSITLWRPR